MMARIGMVNFINTAPLYVIWQQRVHSPDWRVVEGAPAALNRMLGAGELDLGFVSSHEYGANPHLYRVLDGLSISATGPVGSVFLFSRCVPTELSGQTVGLSRQSQTSNALVKIILEEFFRVAPLYADGGGANSASAVVAIGDEALRLRQQGGHPFCLDLSHVWQQHTGLPFVFAVWAVRDDFFRVNGRVVEEIRRELLSCIEQGKRELVAVSRQVAPRIPMDIDDCRRYLSGIEYDLHPPKVQALELFFDYLIKRGELPATALPVQLV
ncbi:MAG: menaquinone biosynthetic enzyme MqnA/MqnD family protein [Thermodesulfobacteriota bacterium]